MPRSPVSALMTRALVSVGLDTPVKEVVGMLVAHDVEALPVIDPVGRPVGVVSEVDALGKATYRATSDSVARFAGPQARARRRRTQAVVAAELMTAPAPTALDSDPVGAAAESLAGAAIGFLFVVNSSGHLSGVLTRRDVLRLLLLRRDGDIQAEIEHALDLVPTAHRIEVSVHDGHVRLHGLLRLCSTVEQVDHVVRRVRGVLAVHNAIRHEIDDLLISGF